MREATTQRGATATTTCVANSNHDPSNTAGDDGRYRDVGEVDQPFQRQKANEMRGSFAGPFRFFGSRSPFIQHRAELIELVLRDALRAKQAHHQVACRTAEKRVDEFGRHMGSRLFPPDRWRYR